MKSIYNKYILIFFLNLIFYFLIIFVNAASQEPIQQKNSSKNKFIIFTSLTNCRFCASPAKLIMENDAFNSFIKNEFEIIYFLSCNREKDIEYFRKKYNIVDSIVRDTINLKQILKLSPRTDFVFLDTIGNIINTDTLMNYWKNKYHKK
jgi:thioredoxin-related protein